MGGEHTNVHVIVVEDGQPMAKVIAENLAVAESASLLVVPCVSHETAKNASDYLRDWAELDGIDQCSSSRAASLTESVLSGAQPRICSAAIRWESESSMEF
jgi:hypothetical protein